MKLQKGFTLMEVLVYITLLSLISVSAVGFLLGVTNAFRMVRLRRNLNNSAQISLERISREIRHAESVVVGESSFGSNPSVLKLNTFDSVGAPETIRFFSFEKDLRVQKNVATENSLIASGVLIDNLVFYRTVTSNSEAVKVEMTLSSSNGLLSVSEKFYNTIVLRKSY